MLPYMTFSRHLHGYWLVGLWTGDVDPLRLSWPRPTGLDMRCLHHAAYIHSTPPCKYVCVVPADHVVLLLRVY